METNTFGNKNLSSNEEKEAAEYLKEHFIEQTNRFSKPVYPKKTIYTRYVKRLLDVLIAFPVFVILLPFNFIFGICTFLTLDLRFSINRREWG